MSSSFVDLECGAAVVQRLLPQRPPFLMVDRVDAFDPGDRPAARASRFLTANEPMFTGHFPDLPLLPGAMLVEGVAQTASLVFTLSRILVAYRERGLEFDQLVQDLAGLDAAYSLRPGARAAGRSILTEAFERLEGMPVGVAGEVRLKFLRPVPPGCRLVYEVQLSHRMGDLLRFAVRALVADELVVEGSLAAAVVADLPLPRR